MEGTSEGLAEGKAEGSAGSTDGPADDTSEGLADGVHVCLTIILDALLPVVRLIHIFRGSVLLMIAQEGKHHLTCHGCLSSCL